MFCNALERLYGLEAPQQRSLALASYLHDASSPHPCIAAQLAAAAAGWWLVAANRANTINNTIAGRRRPPQRQVQAGCSTIMLHHGRASGVHDHHWCRQPLE